jgi:pimeloyl-ACP methyl ester carboxylesterase
MVQIAPTVTLETLDWGGSGPPMVLFAGLGGTAHVFDDLARSLRHRFHVYGVTRRGFGKSSAPNEGYDTDRLAEDDLQVLDALGLPRAVLVGHSIAGLELGSLAARHPERLAGLVLLDTTYLFDKEDKDLFGIAEWHQHLQAVRDGLDRLEAGANDPTAPARQLLDRDWPALDRDLAALIIAEKARPPFQPPGPADLSSFPAFGDWFSRVQGFRVPESELREQFNEGQHGEVTGQKSPQWVSDKILAGQKKYGVILIPALAIIAVRSTTRSDLPDDADSRRAIDAYVEIATARANRRASAFAHDLPNGNVVLMQRVPHFMFLSNESEVVRQIENFVDHLP